MRSGWLMEKPLQASDPARRSLSPPALRELGRERSLARGEALFRQDDPSVGIYEVTLGQVRLSRLDPEGRDIVLHTAGPGDLVAEASLFSTVYNCDATAMTDVGLRFYPKSALLAEFRRDPEAADAFMATLARELMALRTRLERRNIRSAPARVQNYLALNAGADGRTVSVPGTIKNLAEELGLTHEALYRTLSKLEGEGKIVRAKGRIILKSKASV